MKKTIILMMIITLFALGITTASDGSGIGPTGPTDPPLILEMPIGIYGAYPGVGDYWDVGMGTNVYARNDDATYGGAAIVGHGVGTMFANYGYGVVGKYEQFMDMVVIGKGAAGVYGKAECFPSVNTCAGVKGEGLTGGLFIGELTPLRATNIDDTAYFEVDIKGNLHTNGCLIVNEGTPEEQVFGICN